jgi:alkenylglycerophosphocholine hydrolase
MVLAIGFSLTALTNWRSRFVSNDRVELLTKPTATVLTFGMVLASSNAAPGVRWWFGAAMLLCLVGDVALLPAVDQFLVGLGAFLLGHVCFTIGAIKIGIGRGWLMAGLLGSVAVVGLVGSRILGSVKLHQPKMLMPVSAYLGVIGLMAAVLVGTGRPWALVGATAFVVSDSILGWNRFVRPISWSPVAIMATYHLALFGLAMAVGGSAAL